MEIIPFWIAPKLGTALNEPKTRLAIVLSLLGELLTRSRVSSKSDRMKQVHLEDLLSDIVVCVGSETGRPVWRQSLLNEEVLHREQVGSVAPSTGWEEFTGGSISVRSVSPGHAVRTYYKNEAAP